MSLSKRRTGAKIPKVGDHGGDTLLLKKGQGKVTPAPPFLLGATSID